MEIAGIDGDKHDGYSPAKIDYLTWSINSIPIDKFNTNKHIGFKTPAWDFPYNLRRRT